MKKLIAFSAVLLAAVAQADFMKWTVEDSQFDDVEGLGKNVVYARVGYVTDADNPPCWQGTALTVSDMSGKSLGVTDIGWVDGAEFQVDLSGITGLDGDYSFYIELLNSSHTVIGRSESALYSDLTANGFVATGDIGTVPAANVWQGGSGVGDFSAVPEPSSMALLALGAGLVGLRRKLKKAKKGKRA